MTNCSSKNSCCDAVIPTQKAALSVALVGNPNCGKTTLFNALTGARQRIGNWPGVTVEQKSGYFNQCQHTVEVIDLPGVYSLALAPEAVDERIACEFILSHQADVIVNIVDASHLERNLYLTMQLLEMGVPVLLALNMMDVARTKGLNIDCQALSRRLGCPVIALQADKHQGVAELKRALVEYKKLSIVSTYNMPYPAPVQQAIDWLQTHLPTVEKGNNAWLAIRLLEEDAYAKQQVSSEILAEVKSLQMQIQTTCNEDADILIADARYRCVNQAIETCLSTTGTVKTSWTTRIDNIVLNRVLGLPIFLGVMYLLFFFSINIGGAFQDFFDISSQTIFVDGFAAVLTHIGTPTWLIAILANGIGKGINTTITFIPVIGAMFLFLAFLEDSGYMARAAFVVDRLMRVLGLPGKAFVPMIVGFGCNVPAVMASRTLENPRDRIITIMMSPFMSCGARLAIYTVFTTAFFPHGGQNVVFALYLIGIAMAVLTGFLLRQTLLKGDSSPMVMELPVYHMPRWKTLCLHAWQRLKGFVFRAGKLIVPICVLIGVLNTLNMDGSMNVGDGGSAQSLLSMVGRWVTPIFEPMGMHVDNWPATVGLVTGILAKEVVVGTLNTLYTQMGHLAAAGGADFHFWASLKEAAYSIVDNFTQLSQAFSNPILAQAPIHSLDQGVYGVMYQQFDGQAGAFAYLLFVLLYFPCISTMAAMLRELHRGWSVFSAFWMTGVAYAVAVVFYQSVTWRQHPSASAFWIGIMMTAFFGTIFAMKHYAKRGERNDRLNAIPVGELS